MSQFNSHDSRESGRGKGGWKDGVDLKEKHLEMLRLLARGYSIEGIVGEMMYSTGYVYNQLKELRETIGAATNTAAVVEGLRLGVIEIPRPEEMAEW